MADTTKICDPLEPCEGLDGRVLVRRVIYGRALAREARPISFGQIAVVGGVIRPYVELVLETRWVPKGLCRGSLTSVLSLAPTESITAGVRVERRHAFSRLMRDTFESSYGWATTSHSLTESTVQTQTGTGAGGDGGGGLLGELIPIAVDLAPVIIGLFGSFFEDAWDFATDVVDTVSDVAGGTVGFVGDIIDVIFGGDGAGGGGGPIITDTQHQLNEVTTTIEYRESQSHVNQVVVSDSSTTEEFIRRTFSNPYRDRSLQLRFMPVFRHFEVITTLKAVVHGLAFLAGNIDHRVPQIRTVAAATISPGDGGENPALATRISLARLQAKGDYASLQRPINELLKRTQAPSDRKKPVQIQHGLKWRETEVRANAVHVPLAEPEEVIKAWNLDRSTAARFAENIARFAPPKLEGLLKHIQHVNLFAGTHVEAVPGECILPKIITDSLSVDKDVDLE